MTNETRSLWEIAASEVEPWRRGRSQLLFFGFITLLFQTIQVGAAIIAGNLDFVFGFSTGSILFWFQFYLVWIGVTWLRWVLGTWNVVIGFYIFFGSMANENGLGLVVGALIFIMGACLFSPSVHAFAKHQKEFVRWKEALLFGVACLVILVGVTAAGFALAAFREQLRRDACDFADEAVRRIFVSRDESWSRAHVSKRVLRRDGQESMTYFFVDLAKRFGRTQRVLPADGTISMKFLFPASFETTAHLKAQTETDHGLADLQFVLHNPGDHWEIDMFWWRYPPPEGPH